MSNLYKTLRLTLAIACLIAGSACTQVKLGTLWSMRDVDLLMVDPGVMRLALELPDGASISVASIGMEFIRGGETLIDEGFDLEIISQGPELLQHGLPANKSNLIVLRVPQSRVADLINFQNLFVAERAAPQGSTASFGIDSKLDPAWIKDNCASGMKTVEISAWILVDSEQGYLPLLEDSRLGKLLDAQTNNFCQM